MIQAYQYNDREWIIVRKPSDEGVTGSTSAGQRPWPSLDCWTGKRWVDLIVLAKRFPSREEAAAYIEDNRANMESPEAL